jgi:hypothetical protein
VHASLPGNHHPVAVKAVGTRVFLIAANIAASVLPLLAVGHAAIRRERWV